MQARKPLLWAAAFSLAIGSAMAQTAPGAPGTNQVIPEKEAPPNDSPKSDVQTGRSLSQKLDSSGGVIAPPSGVDPGMNRPAPVENPNSTPVIHPPGTPGGPPGPEAK